VSWLWSLPFAAQALLMGTDELWFHRRRGLPRWERIGHPLDTLSVLVCVLWAWAAPAPSPPWVWGYLALAAGSCALVTKDEGVHAVRCTAAEHWLHAALFVLHPLVLGAVALLWCARAGAPLGAAAGDWLGAALPGPQWAARWLAAQAAALALFALYQALYWSGRRA
jgi:hypothetical protein